MLLETRFGLPHRLPHDTILPYKPSQYKCTNVLFSYHFWQPYVTYMTVNMAAKYGRAAKYGCQYGRSAIQMTVNMAAACQYDSNTQYNLPKWQLFVTYMTVKMAGLGVGSDAKMAALPKWQLGPPPRTIRQLEIFKIKFSNFQIFDF